MNQKDNIYKLIKNICLLLFITIAVPLFYQNYDKIILYNKITQNLFTLTFGILTIIFPIYLIWKSKKEWSITRIIIIIGIISFSIGTLSITVIPNIALQNIAAKGIGTALFWCFGYALLKGGATLFGLGIMCAGLYQFHQMIKLLFF